MSSGRQAVAERARDTVTEALMNGRLCPVLGTGASAQVGTPDWATLVWRLAAERGYVDTERELPEAWMTADLQLVAELVIHPDLSTVLREELYRQPRSWVETGIEDEKGDAVLAFRDSALASLAWLCVLTAWSNPDRPYHGVTYNYDCYLEEAISALGHDAVAFAPPNVEEKWTAERTPLERSLVPVRSRRLQERLPRGQKREVRILHAHGIAPRPGRRRFSTARSDSGDSLVLSEDQYERRKSEPLGPFSIAQTSAFAQLVAVFYGFSFADSAVRSLLRASRSVPGRQELPPHVALLRMEAPGVPSEPALEAEWTRYMRAIGIVVVRTDSFSPQERFLREVLGRTAEKSGNFDLV